MTLSRFLSDIKLQILSSQVRPSWVRNILRLALQGRLQQGSLHKDAITVDAVVSTVGFPLVGGPAGTMEGGRQADIAKTILLAKNVPYIVAAPLLIQVWLTVRTPGRHPLELDLILHRTQVLYTLRPSPFLSSGQIHPIISLPNVAVGRAH